MSLLYLILLSSISFASFGEDAKKCADIAEKVSAQLKGTKKEKDRYFNFLLETCIRNNLNHKPNKRRL